MRGGNKLQYNYKRRHLYTLHCLCCWNTKKCNLYNNDEYRVYRLHCRLYVQYHNKCCDVYSMYNLSNRSNSDCSLYYYDKSCLCVYFSDPNGYAKQN